MGRVQVTYPDGSKELYSIIEASEVFGVSEGSIMYYCASRKAINFIGKTIHLKDHYFNYK